MPCELFFCWTSGIPPLSTVLVSASLRNVFTGAHSSFSAHGFPRCLQLCWPGLSALDSCVTQRNRLAQKSVSTAVTANVLKGCLFPLAAHLMVWRCRRPGTTRTANSITRNAPGWCSRQNVCLYIVHVHVCVRACLHMCVCHTCQVEAPGELWQEPLKFISVRPSCQSSWQAAPTQRCSEVNPTRTPENPWPCFDRELG